MARTPGPIWVEFNSDLARSDDYRCLPDALKAAYTTWAMLYPAGDLGPLPKLAAAVVKTTKKTSGIVDDLVRAGFLKKTPNGSLVLSDGWVRAHKGSAQRMAKMRAGAKPNCDVTIEPNVTAEVTLHRLDSDVTLSVTSDVTVTPQKEISPTPPLRKTTLNPANAELSVGARARAIGGKLPMGGRWLWPEGAEIPENWQQRAARELAQRGRDPVDMPTVCLDFSGHYCTDTTPRTYTEWMQKFLKWTRHETPKGTMNGTRHRISQFEQFAAIAQRESETEIFQN